jgi:hypothetical protein
MYHQEGTKRSSFMKVAFTYGMSRTSSKYAQMGCSEGVYQWKKDSKSLNDVTYHHMEDIMEHSEHMQNLEKWILLANHVPRYKGLCPKVWIMLEAR